MLKLADQIDAILPQTQCGLCGFKGCRPYAEALATHETPINLCPPGGVETLGQLAKLLKEDPKVYLTEMQLKEKPAQLAVIREEECIGCTKCIQVCPTDAIVGAAKQMHSILNADCSGCGLCLSPCPVDCIDLINLPPFNSEQKIERREHFRERYQIHQQRTQKQVEKNSAEEQDALQSLNLSINERLSEIKAALNRAKVRKNGS